MQNLTMTTSETALANFEKFALGADSSLVQFLKFAKTGQFVYGQEEAVVDEDDRFIASMDTLSKGFICWKDGKPMGEEMARLTSNFSINKSELEDFSPYTKPGDGWKDQTSLEFINVETEETLLFKASSHGGQKALGALTKEVIDRVKRGETNLIPVVAMVPGSYKHKDFGKIYFPKFEVQKWVSSAEDLDGFDDEGNADNSVIEVVKNQPKRSIAPLKS